MLGGLRGAQQESTQSLEIGLVCPFQRGERLADKRAQQVGDLLLAQAAEVAGWGWPSTRLLREELAENDIVGLAAFFHLAETQLLLGRQPAQADDVLGSAPHRGVEDGIVCAEDVQEVALCRHANPR